MSGTRGELSSDEGTGDNCHLHRTWQQRYWAGWDLYTPGGPVFLLIGGEGEESPGWLQAGALRDYAQQFGGLHPSSDTSEAFCDRSHVYSGAQILR